MPTENKSNKIITIVLALIITLAAITVIYINLPQNKEKTSNENKGSQGEGNKTTTPVILTVTYGNNHTNYTLEGLEALESYIGMGGYRNSVGSIKGKGNYTGVNVTRLVELTAGSIQNYSINVTSNDGKEIENKTFTYSEILGDVDIYDPNNPSNSTPIGNGGLTMVLAYKYEGSYFNELKDGKLRTTFLDESGSITSSGLWWKYVTSIKIIE